MAGTERKRIIELTEASTIQNGDFIAVDSNARGTKKVSTDTLATSAALTAETNARAAADNTLDGKISDIRVGANGITYPSAGDAVRGQVGDLKSDLDTVHGEDIVIPRISGWIDGEYIKTEDGTVGQAATYHRTDYIEINPNFGAINFINSNGGSYDVVYNAWYDENKTFISSFATRRDGAIAIMPPSNARYMRLSFNKTTTNTISQPFVSDYDRWNWLVSNNLTVDAPIWSNRLYWYDDELWLYAYERICMQRTIKAKSQIKVSVNSGYKYAIMVFSAETVSSATKVSTTSWLTSDNIIDEGTYFLISLAKSNDGSISPSDGINLSLVPIVDNSVSRTWSNVIYWYGDGIWWNSNTRIGLQTPIVASSKMRVSVSKGYKYAIFRFSANPPSTTTELSSTGWLFSDAIIDKGDIVIINMAKADDSAITPTDSTNIILEPISDTLESPTNYVVGSDLLKRATYVYVLGALTYEQAFCKYDGKYYSINGSSITEQDNSFNVLRTVSLNTGHGNGLQLGNGNIAYASGWNDNNIYAVNLDTLTIDHTIALPTTGYTTGVVDENKNLAYIFQRDTYPDTEDNYNFIVYDLTNQQIVSTKKILAFGAMQAADFFNDRIIVLNGLGNSACPNGYRVFDTDGNILADYYLGNFDTTEPEGVCIDRDSHELMVSFVDRKIYKLTV